jgi:hypothetical protein
MENWHVFINEDTEQLHEGPMLDGIKLDMIALINPSSGLKPNHTIGTFLNKLKKSRWVQKWKGGYLVGYLNLIQKTLPSGQRSDRPSVWPNPDAEMAHKSRQLDQLKKYAKQNPEKSFKEIIEDSNNIKHARDPETKELATGVNHIIDILAQMAEVGYEIAKPDELEGFAENKIVKQEV